MRYYVLFCMQVQNIDFFNHYELRMQLKTYTEELKSEEKKYQRSSFVTILQPFVQEKV